MNIIEANESHIPAIQSIYAHHVNYGIASFETEPPSCEEMSARLAKVREEGLKHGRWVDTVILQRPLGQGSDTLPATADSARL